MSILLLLLVFSYDIIFKLLITVYCYYVENTMDITKTLAVSLWQRAQLLISMDLYTLALADIKLALAEGLPAKYKGEAFWKMGVCHKVRGEEQKAKVCFELAEKLLVDKDTLRKDMEKEWIKEDGYNKCPKGMIK